MLSLLCILIIAWSSTRARRSKVHWIISFHLNFYFIHHNRTLYMQMTSFVEWLPAPLSARDGGWSVEGPMNGFRSSGGNLCFCRPKIKKNLSRSGFCSETKGYFYWRHFPFIVWMKRETGGRMRVPWAEKKVLNKRLFWRGEKTLQRLSLL